MCDALIVGLSSTPNSLCLLENQNLAFQEAYNQHRAPELVCKNSEAYQNIVISSVTTKSTEHTSTSNDETEISEVLKASSLLDKSIQLCFFCGKHRHLS